jgi:HEAT repeat protein
MTPILLLFLLCAPAQAADRQPGPESSSSSSQTKLQLSDEQIRERIETYLGSIDTPIRSAHWRALGSRGAAILEGIAQDDGALPTRRAKALDGLAAIGSSTAADVMLRLARSEQTPLAVRLSAVRGAARVLPADQVAPALQPVLEGAKDGHVRRAAAEALSNHGGCMLVRAQAAREDDPQRLHRAVQRCGR